MEELHIRTAHGDTNNINTNNIHENPYQSYSHSSEIESIHSDSPSEVTQFSSDEESCGEDCVTYSLFDDFSSFKSNDVWLHMSQKYDFSKHNFLKLKLDVYAFISLINHLRSIKLKDGHNAAIREWNEILENKSSWNKNSNMHLQSHMDDRLLWDQPDELFDILDYTSNTGLDTNTESKADNEVLLREENESLKLKINSLRSILTLSTNDDSDLLKAQPKGSQSLNDQLYFSGYSDFHIHREMVLDGVRTNSYGRFILEHQDLFKEKIVLDVGCGSSILSLFACKAGAKLVVAVDASDNIIKLANQIIERNNMQSKIRTFNSKVEDLKLYTTKHDNSIIVTQEKTCLYDQNELIPFHCDIIISEWMGYSLLFESMLNSVINARDRFLKPNGLIFPNFVTIGVYGLDYSEPLHNKLSPWNSLYGFDLSPLGPSFNEIFKVPEICITPPDLIKTPLIPICGLNILKIAEKDLSNLTASCEMSPLSPITSIGIYFDCFFDTSLDYQYPIAMFQEENHNCFIKYDCFYSLTNNPVILHTNPFETPTHWKQTILHLSDEAEKSLALTSPFKMQLHFIPHENQSRGLRLILEFKSQLEDKSGINSFELL